MRKAGKLVKEKKLLNKKAFSRGIHPLFFYYLKDGIELKF